MISPSYHQVQKGLDFDSSKKRCAYDNSIIQRSLSFSYGAKFEYFDPNFIFRI